jgi:two-component system LytT family response regulator
MIKVLVVDDENKTREFIAKLIRSFGLDLEVIAQGENVETAIEAIQEHKPNLVLLDIQMPDGTGFDVLKRIENKNFEVIFITAHQEFAIKAIKFSALDYILKPVDPEELRQAIEMAIQSINSKKDEIQFDALNHNLVPHQKRKLVLKTQESVFVVELDDIIRCEADKNYTFFFL